MASFFPGHGVLLLTTVFSSSRVFWHVCTGVRLKQSLSVLTELLLWLSR